MAGGGGKVVERVVEVDDVDAVRERLRKEIEARMKQDLSEEAMKAAREVGQADVTYSSLFLDQIL